MRRGGCGHSERVAFVHAVIVEAVDAVAAAVVGRGAVGCDEEELPGSIGQHLKGAVVALRRIEVEVCQGRDAAVVGLRRAFHRSAQVCPHCVGRKFQDGQVAKRGVAHASRVYPGVNGYDPLVALGDEAMQIERVARQEDAASEQNGVLRQRLPVGQNQCLAEAAAVGHGIFQIYPNSQRSHRRHEEEREARGQFAAYTEQDIDTQHELEHANAAGCEAHREVAVCKRLPHCQRIRFELVAHALRVYDFHEPRKDKCAGEQQAAERCHPIYYYMCCFILQWSAL